MESKYKFPSILLNGRTVAIKDILTEKEYPLTPFEQDVIDFCHQWLTNRDLFYFKTSGSTGKPNEIAVKRSQINASIKMTAETLQLSNEFNALLSIPVANTGGKMMIARAFQLQMRLECIEPVGNPLLKATRTPDFMAVVPLQINQMINDNTKRTLDKAKKIIVGGAKVDGELLQKIQHVNTPVYATYGMTETVSHIALQLLNTADKQQYFQILPDIQIAKDDRDCLKIKGPVTDNLWVQTNDRVRLINSKQFEWLGRTDLVINSGGHKIQPEVVEQKLKLIFNDKAIENSFFIHGLPHKILGEECTLIMEGQPLPASVLIGIQDNIKDKIDAYQRPKSIRFIENFKFTDSGKLDRRKTLEGLNYSESTVYKLTF